MVRHKRIRGPSARLDGFPVRAGWGIDGKGTVEPMYTHSGIRPDFMVWARFTCFSKTCQVTCTPTTPWPHNPDPQCTGSSGH
jgi:hypothetical protein